MIPDPGLEFAPVPAHPEGRLTIESLDDDAMALDGDWALERNDEDLVISRFTTLRVDDKENDYPSVDPVQHASGGRCQRRTTRRYNPY